MSPVELVRRLIADIDAATWATVSCFIFARPEGKRLVFWDYSDVRKLMEESQTIAFICAAIERPGRRVGHWFVEDNMVFRVPDTQLFSTETNAPRREPMGKMQSEAFFELAKNLIEAKMKDIGLNPAEVLRIQTLSDKELAALKAKYFVEPISSSSEVADMIERHSS